MNGTHAKALRTKEKLNQYKFWTRIGVSQSGGSRYERGNRPIPKPISLLLSIAYGSDGAAHALYHRLRVAK